MVRQPYISRSYIKQFTLLASETYLMQLKTKQRNDNDVEKFDVAF